MSPKYRIVPDKDYILWQLPCSEDKTGMGYIISSADGRCFVIDGGNAFLFLLFVKSAAEKLLHGLLPILIPDMRAHLQILLQTDPKI